MRSGVEILVEDDAVLEGKADGVVDDALAALADRQAFVGPQQAGQDRQAGGVGARPPQRPQRVRPQVEAGAAVGVPARTGTERAI